MMSPLWKPDAQTGLETINHQKERGRGCLQESRGVQEAPPSKT